VSRGVAFVILLVCALVEAGGDALIRKGIHATALLQRVVLYFAGAAALFAYGWLVNRPPWSFGSLLGVYVVLFFVVAQLAAICVFGERPGAPILVGGTLILSGGLLITFWR
jgi:small multidrug resistance family-3 protein